MYGLTNGMNINTLSERESHFGCLRLFLHKTPEI